MTDDELEELLEHTATARELATLESVVADLRTRAGELFTSGKDDLAKEVRRLTNELDDRSQVVRLRLQEHIDRAVAKAEAARKSPATKTKREDGT